MAKRHPVLAARVHHQQSSLQHAKQVAKVQQQLKQKQQRKKIFRLMSATLRSQRQAVSMWYANL
jgi:hypothetical protein